MNPFALLEENFICPHCLDKFKKETSLKLSKSGYDCLDCKKNYPIKKIVYILKDRCNPKKCKLECIGSCERKAIKKTTVEERGNFMLKAIIKNIISPKIVIESTCNNCCQCIRVCPFNALIAINIPVFPSAESFPEKNNTIENKKIDLGTFNFPLRPMLEINEIRPASLLLYEIIYREIKNKEANKIIIDNGSGSNFTKLFVSNKNILSFDIRADHNAFYPLNLITNGEHLPIKKNFVDIFISVNVLEHVTNPFAYLSEMRRTLKKDGKLIIAAPTPWWHLSKILSLHHCLNYVIHIIKNPLRFLKTPFNDFNTFWSHEKDCNYENTKQTSTLVREIKNFNTKRWEKLFNESGFIIKKAIGAGNIFSNNVFAGKITRALGNSRRWPIFFVYILKK